MKKVSSEKMSQVLKPRGLGAGLLPSDFLHTNLVFCTVIPCWPWVRPIWNILGRNRWELGSWILIWPLPHYLKLLCLLPLAFNCDASSKNCALCAEALRTNSLIFQHQCNRGEESQIIIWSFYLVWCTTQHVINWRLQSEE